MVNKIHILECRRHRGGHEVRGVSVILVCRLPLISLTKWKQ